MIGKAKANVMAGMLGLYSALSTHSWNREYDFLLSIMLLSGQLMMIKLIMIIIIILF